MSRDNATAASLRSPPGARYAVVASRWNGGIVDALVEGARRAFADCGVDENALTILRVPGAWELPMLAAKLAVQQEYAAIVALGCVVRGETRHYEQVADECARGLMRVALDSGVPVLNGVLAVEREADARARAGGMHGNKGGEVARAAVEMAAVMRECSA
ncbi:MAG: 6,7-dimethyl-8-ribityllumazine synthase [Proteobacteria bacterium]|nr:6,7-dimethyl-8-ribityllumazine synthase [Pseudomonadota bacterium]